MISWLLTTIGIFSIVTVIYYFKLILDSKNKIKNLNYYMKMHFEHLENINSKSIDKFLANKIIFDRVRIGELINYPHPLSHENYLNPRMVEYQLFDINDALVKEKMSIEKLLNPKYAIKKTLAIPANFLNLIFPIKDILKNLVNFIFWICTVLLPFITKLLELLQ